MLPSVVTPKALYDASAPTAIDVCSVVAFSEASSIAVETLPPFPWPTVMVVGVFQETTPAVVAAISEKLRYVDGSPTVWGRRDDVIL